MSEAVIVSIGRTPIGRAVTGSLVEQRPDIRAAEEQLRSDAPGAARLKSCPLATMHLRAEGARG